MSLPVDPPSPAELNQNARTVLERRYLVRDETGAPLESPEDMFWRVSRVIAEADARYGARETVVKGVAEEFYRLMTQRRFEPNSPTLMNAGRPLGQLSACFVLPVADSLSNGKDGIYDTLTAMALIHQSGGGCIAGDGRVWTTFCGVEPIAVLFNRATVDGRPGVAKGNGRAFDVRDLNIRTLSMDPESGKTALRAVTHVWKFDVPAQHQIVVRTRDGAEVQTSDWHPFMVMRETWLQEMRADALLEGDIILGPGRPETYWPWNKEAAIAGIPVTVDLAWLIGFTLGDGSFGYVPALRQNRVRWFSGTRDVLDRVRAALAVHGIDVAIQSDPRGKGLVLATLSRSLVYWLREACGLPGNGRKDATIRVPEHIGKSPLPVVRAFVAGLMDSDGHVERDGSPSYTTASEDMARDVAALVSLLGYRPSVRRKDARGKGRLPTYTVLMCPLPQVDEFAADIAPFMSHEARKARLRSSATKQSALRLPFRAWRDVLRSHGLIGTRRSGAGSCAAELNRWSCNEAGRVNRRNLATIADALAPYDSERAALLKRVAQTGQEIATVGRAVTPKAYYDLTVEEWNTYAAGRDSLVMIHNTGFSFSRLRPKGSMVRSTTGVASGPVSFMKLYDASTDAVKQGGSRRGANMGILRVDHPDIMEFIACKEDLAQVTNFNISVAVTDAFMAAVKAGTSYDLKDPHTGNLIGQLDANTVWDTMIRGAWRTGEPGCFFIDEANRYNPVPHLGSYEATNPCVVGPTRLATDRGLLTMEELCRDVIEIKVVTDNRVIGIREYAAGSGVEVRAKQGTSLRYAVPVFKTRDNAPVFRLETTHGYTVTATSNHKFFTRSGLVQLADLKAGDEILLQSGEGAWSTDHNLPKFEPTAKFRGRGDKGEAHLPRQWSRELGQTLGWLVADGWTSQEAPAGRSVCYSVGFLFGGDERPLAEGFRARLRHWTGMDGHLVERPGRWQLIYRSGMYYFLRSLGVTGPDERKRVPSSIWRAPREAVIGFLQGMFTADGTVNISAYRKTCSVRLASSDPVLLEEVQLLLLNLGIVSKRYRRRHAQERAMPDGRGGIKTCPCLAQYELILDKANRDAFVRVVGFLSPAKQQKAERWIAQKEKASNREHFVTRVLSIEPAGAEDVYCTTEHVTHSIVANGFVTAQCGEQPLIANDVCNLGSINVGHYVKDGQMDWAAFRRDIHLSTHFLDNIIDVNRYPLAEIDRLSKRIRRIGLGIMGFADALVRLGIAYDSTDAVEFGRKVMAFLDTESKRESERLAHERGAFPEWERSIWGPDETCARDSSGKRIRPKQLLRNCNVTTIAPTGTISIIAGCSSGLEPLFAVAFMRNQAGVLMPDVNEDFVAIAKREGWYSDALMERIAREGRVDFPEVPAKWQRVFVTANRIAPEWHVRMQATFQEHCDSGISKTTNFAHTASVEDVRAIYELAYSLKCKGVTVYRDGSRDNQVLSTGATDKAKAAREKSGAGSTPSVSDRREVGELQGQIAELTAEIERLKRTLYEAEAENTQRRAKRARPDKLRGTTMRYETPLGVMFVNVTEDERGQPFEVFINLGKAGGSAMADAEAMGRLISLALRSGIPLREIHRQLRGIASDRIVGLGPKKIMSVPDGIALALEEWWRDHQEGVQQDLLGSPTPQAGVPLRDALPTAAAVAVPKNGNGASVAGPQSAFQGYDAGTSFIGTCPDCGSQLEFAEGCVKCHVCGFSECG